MLTEPEPSSVYSAPADKEKFGGLTAREREVAVLIAEGKSNREIARVMTVGVKTIETYVTRILNNLDLILGRYRSQPGRSRRVYIERSSE